MKKNTSNQIYLCHYTDDVINIDGQLTEKAWKKAKIGMVQKTPVQPDPDG